MLKRTVILWACFIILLDFQSQCLAFTDNDEVDQLRRLIAMQSDNIQKVDHLIQLSQAYRRRDTDSALICCDQALQIAEKLDYGEGIAQIFYKKSLIYRSIGEHNQALNFARKTLQLGDSLKDSLCMAKAYFQLATILRETPDKKAALDYYMKSLHLYSDQKDTTSMISLYNGLGIFFEQTSNYDSAAIYFHKTIALSEIKGVRENLGVIFGNLGNVYYKLGDFINARKYLELSIGIDKEYGDLKNNMANTFTRLGNLANQENNLHAAMDYFRQADSIYQETNEAKGHHDIHLCYADIYRQLEKINLSLENYDEAMRYYRENRLSEGMIAVWQGKASVYAGRENYDMALLLYDSCLSMATESGDMSRLREVLGNIAEIYFKAGNFEASLKYYKRYQQVKDSIFDLEKSETINDLRLKYEKEKDQLRILNLEKDNLAKDLRITKRTNQRNIYSFTALGIAAIAAFLLIFLRNRAKKNKIIAEQKITQLEEEKKLLAVRSLVEGQEEERKRIAKELHDGLGVLLSTTKMQFSAIRETNPESKALIEKASKLLEQASGDVRKISHNMMPGLLTRLGLFEALEDLFENLADTRGIQTSLEIKGAAERLPENKEIMIYRIVQEMANNTLKHAEAANISMQVEVHPKSIALTYSDDGKGFPVGEKLAQKSLGLQSIRSRVKFLDGNISIESSLGKGVLYDIVIPLN